MLKMKLLILVIFVTVSDQQDEGITQRLGLLATELGLNPLGTIGSGDVEDTNSPLVAVSDIPKSSDLREEEVQNRNCCCTPQNQACPDPESPASSTVAAPQVKPDNSDQLIFFGRSGRSVRSLSSESLDVCPPNLDTCCYPPSTDISSLECSSPSLSQQRTTSWQQGCPESNPIARSSSKECGTRVFDQGLDGDSKPGEFPWTCLVLTVDNGFIGNCVIIPSPTGQGNTNRVVTAAHKLNNIDDKKIESPCWRS